MDDGSQIPGDEEDGVDIRRDHPSAGRLGEHEPPAGPAGEGGEGHPEAEG